MEAAVDLGEPHGRVHKQRDQQRVLGPRDHAHGQQEGESARKGHMNSISDGIDRACEDSRTSRSHGWCGGSGCAVRGADDGGSPGLQVYVS